MEHTPSTPLPMKSLFGIQYPMSLTTALLYFKMAASTLVLSFIMLVFFLVNFTLTLTLPLMFAGLKLLAVFRTLRQSF